jgi:hypothetical protein
MAMDRASPFTFIQTGSGAVPGFAFGYLTIRSLIKFAREINVASLAFLFGIIN